MASVTATLMGWIDSIGFPLTLGIFSFKSDIYDFIFMLSSCENILSSSSIILRIYSFCIYFFWMFSANSVMMTSNIMISGNSK